MNAHVASLLAVVFLPCFSLAQEERSWAGERIIPIRPSKEIQFSIVVEGTKASLQLNNLAAFICREERGGYLRIHDGRREGWVPKSDFVKGTDAMQYFDRQLSTDPGNFHALFMRGIGWQEMKEHDKAIKDYSECLRIEPKNYAAMMNRANAWTSKKDYDKAIRDYDEALKIAPKYALAYGNRGDVRMRMKQYDKALKDFDEAIRLSPQDARAYVDRGRCQRRRKEYDKAIADFNKSIGIDSKSAYTYLDRSDVWLEKSDFDKAIRDCNDAIRLDPKLAYAFVSRGRVWFAKKYYAKAEEDFDQALHLAPTFTSTYLERGVNRAAMKRFDKALDDFDRIVPPSNQVPYARIIGNLTARKAGNDEAAKRYLEDADRAANADWPAPVLRYLRGDLTEAQMLKTAKTNDEQTEAYAYLALDLLLKGKEKDALPHLRWVKTNGNRAYIEYQMAVQQLEAIEPATATPKKK
ncbi:MAG: tetratricopeptide repeat protein [Gemmataceae bacterium]